MRETDWFGFILVFAISTSLFSVGGSGLERCWLTEVINRKCEVRSAGRWTAAVVTVIHCAGWKGPFFLSVSHGAETVDGSVQVHHVTFSYITFNRHLIKWSINKKRREFILHSAGLSSPFNIHTLIKTRMGPYKARNIYINVQYML